jgi:hypothetical protein
MFNQQFLDPISISGVFALIVVLLLAAYEVGFRIGRWWQIRTPEETEGPTDALVGSIIAFLAFLLAITMGMASDRFDTRRALVLDEANAIHTAYLRAGYIPEPYSDESRKLLREYVPLRVNTDDRAMLAANFARSLEIQGELWTMVEQMAKTESSDVFALYIESVNDVIDANEARSTAIINARVPETVVILLILGAGITLGMVGYSAGLTRRRSPLTAGVLVVLLAVVLTLVIDLDRPRNGFIQVSQQPILDLMTQIGPP